MILKPSQIKIQQIDKFGTHFALFKFSRGKDDEKINYEAL